MSITVKDIVQMYLVENGYDGLAGDGCGYGCELVDLMEDCNGECIADCAPAMKVFCKPEDCEDCRSDCDGHTRRKEDGAKRNWRMEARK